MVDVANDMARAISRQIDWIHFPAPLARTDRVFFAPFADLDLSNDTEIYLGILHVSEGLAGVKKRADVAKEFLPAFGIATECGIARARKPDVVKKTLALYAAAADVTNVIL